MNEFLLVLILLVSGLGGLSETISSALSLSPRFSYNNNNNNNNDFHDNNNKFDVPLKYCQNKAKCEPLAYTICMGARVPYAATTLALTNSGSQSAVQEKLHHFREYLRYVPKCWAVIQPFLCALYMPKCENNLVDLPSKEMCSLTLEPCKIFYNNTTIFPDFINCSDDRMFPSKCKNDVHELKFNTTGSCMEPLVKTDHSDWFYPGVEGCGLHCKDSLYTENEHYQIHKLMAYCVLLCIFFNLFTIITFMIDWSTANKYPALAIFYINVCFFISYVGWLIQFLGADSREDIVCKKDGTLRKSEPSASENLSCVVVFVMVYYFLIAGMVWFVIFSYAWHMSSLQALGKIQERVDKKRAYFHLVAWSLPLILTITTMALGEIDGDYVTGICFVGFINGAARTGLLLTPLAAAIIVAGYIIVRGLILLIKVKIESREVISEHSNRKIRSNIVRMGVFALFMIIFSVITFIYHGYLSINSDVWAKSLQNYILCKLTSLSTDYSHCKQDARPSVAMLQLQLLAVFGGGIAMASWVWCAATLHSWSRYIRRKFHCEVEEPMKLQKHKIIAQAFAKRRKFNEGGKISIECQNHTDPVGLHFDLNSAASNGLSTTWAANLPRLVNRRGAMINDGAYSISSNNQSIDSEVSLNVRHVSIESRRNSGDSQLSVQIAELKATRKINSRSSHHRGRRHNNNNKRNDFRRNSRRMSKQRESSTSLDSHLQLINAALSAGTNGTSKVMPNLNRRKATAGLDERHINKLLSKGKLMIPWDKLNVDVKNHSNNNSEDENVSVTISESKFNIRTTNNMDLNDQLVIKSLRQGLQIDELSSNDDSCGSNDNLDYHHRATEKRYSNSGGRESHRSKQQRSRKRSRSKKKYNNSSSLNDHHDKYYPDQQHDHDDNSSDSSSSCAEIKQLVQSSLNSGVSVVGHGSRQSKTSIDVAVQANAQDIVLQTAAYDLELQQSLKNKKYEDLENEKNIKMKRFDRSKYDDRKYDNDNDEYEPLTHHHQNNDYDNNINDNEELLIDKNKYSNNINIRKSKEIC